MVRRTFRDSDILSRIGGDQFVIFAIPMDKEGVTVTGMGSGDAGRLECCPASRLPVVAQHRRHALRCSGTTDRRPAAGLRRRVDVFAETNEHHQR